MMESVSTNLGRVKTVASLADRFSNPSLCPLFSGASPRTTAAAVSVRGWMAGGTRAIRQVSLVGVLAFCAVGPANGQSLWHARAPERVNLIGVTAARRVGDLITILINENTDVANKDQRKLGKSSDGGFSFDVSSSSSTPANVDLSGKSSRNFNGQSQYSVEQEFTDRITVEVLDVLPNGNLVIGGQRQRIVAGERRTLVLSGTVRSIDVSPNNTVSSTHVANFHMQYGGNGAESGFTNQGWAARTLTRIWPF